MRKMSTGNRRWFVVVITLFAVIAAGGLLVRPGLIRASYEDDPEPEPTPASTPCQQYSLSVITYTYPGEEEGGSVSPSTGDFCKGKEVIITASPASGYEVLYWDGAPCDEVNSCEITMDRDKSVTVIFALTGCEQLRREIEKLRDEIQSLERELARLNETITNHPVHHKIETLKNYIDTLRKIQRSIQVISEGTTFYSVITGAQAGILTAKFAIAVGKVVIGEITHNIVMNALDIDSRIAEYRSQIETQEKILKPLTDKRADLIGKISSKEEEVENNQAEFDARGCKEE